MANSELEGAIKELTFELRRASRPGPPGPELGAAMPFGEGIEAVSAAAGGARRTGLLEAAGVYGGLYRYGAQIPLIGKGLQNILQTAPKAAQGMVALTVESVKLFQSMEAGRATLQNIRDPLGEVTTDIAGLQQRLAELGASWAYGQQFAEDFLNIFLQLQALRPGRDFEGDLLDAAESITILQNTLDPGAFQKVQAAMTELGLTAGEATDMVWDLTVIAAQSQLPYEIYSRAVLSVVSNLKAWGLTVDDVKIGLAGLMKTAYETGVALDLTARDYAALARVMETAGPQPELAFFGILLQQAQDLPREVREALDKATRDAQKLGRVSAGTFAQVRPEEMQFVYKEIEDPMAQSRVFLEIYKRLQTRLSDMAPVQRTMITQELMRTFGMAEIEDVVRMTDVIQKWVDTTDPEAQAKLEKELAEMRGEAKDSSKTRLRWQYDMLSRLLDMHGTLQDFYKAWMAQAHGGFAGELNLREMETRHVEREMRRKGATKELTDRWLDVQQREAGAATPAGVREAYSEAARAAIEGKEGDELEAAFGKFGLSGSRFRTMVEVVRNLEAEKLQKRRESMIPTGPRVMGSPEWQQAERTEMALKATEYLITLGRYRTYGHTVSDVILNLSLEAAGKAKLRPGMTEPEFEMEIMDVIIKALTQDPKVQAAIQEAYKQMKAAERGGVS